VTTSHGRSLNPGGWRTSIQGPAVISRPTAAPAPATPTTSKGQKARGDLPERLATYAPLFLTCQWCGLPQLAGPDGILLWHREDRGGEWFQCTGVNSRGLPLEEDGQ